MPVLWREQAVSQEAEPLLSRDSDQWAPLPWPEPLPSQQPSLLHSFYFPAYSPLVLAYSATSVMSDSLWTHGLYPARLLCPWAFPGKNTGVGGHFLLQGIFPTKGSKPHRLHCRQILYHWATGECPLSTFWGHNFFQSWIHLIHSEAVALSWAHPHRHCPRRVSQFALGKCEKELSIHPTDIYRVPAMHQLGCEFQGCEAGEVVRHLGCRLSVGASRRSSKSRADTWAWSRLTFGAPGAWLVSPQSQLGAGDTTVNKTDKD